MPRKSVYLSDENVKTLEYVAKETGRSFSNMLNYVVTKHFSYTISDVPVVVKKIGPKETGEIKGNSGQTSTRG